MRAHIMRFNPIQPIYNYINMELINIEVASIFWLIALYVVNVHRRYFLGSLNQLQKEVYHGS